MTLAGLVVLDRRAINQQDVHPAVIVIVERGGAAALRFDDVEFFLAAAVQVKVNARGPGDVNEQWWIGRGSLRARLGRRTNRFRR